jgi:hypothetical protein
MRMGVKCGANLSPIPKSAQVSDTRIDRGWLNVVGPEVREHKVEWGVWLEF